MEVPRRYRLKLTPHEIDRFVAHLRSTGNATLAAERLGRHRSTFVKRVRRDPALAARCGAALAEFHAQSLERHGFGGGDPFATAGALRHRRGELVLMHGRKRPAQLRRAGGGEMTRDALHAFLAALAATANLRLAADSVGICPNAVRVRRRRDPAFDRAVHDALGTGYARLESALLHQARKMFGDDGETAESIDPIVGQMSVDQAMMLLAQHRRTCRLGWETKRRKHLVATPEEIVIALERRLKTFRWPKP